MVVLCSPAACARTPQRVLTFILLATYAVLSATTFAVYAWDMSAARGGRWRTPEFTLHLLSLLGGWPGALAAQRTLRHKSRKLSFQIVFWLTVIVNCCALLWLLVALGSHNSGVAS